MSKRERTCILPATPDCSLHNEFDDEEPKDEEITPIGDSPDDIFHPEIDDTEEDDDDEDELDKEDYQ